MLTLASLVLVGVVVLGSACGPSSPPAAKPQPAPPGTPVSNPITATVGPAGGTLGTPDGKLTINLPAGAVPAPTVITIREITNTAPRGFGSAYQLEPSGTTFRRPVAITFSARDLGVPIGNIGIAFQDATGYWTPVASVLRNLQAQLLTVQSAHFSAWALVPTNPSLDMAGSFTITSTLDLPLTATGSANLGYAGEDASERYYLLSGTTTLQPPVTYNGVACAPPDPGGGPSPNPASVYAFPSNLVEGFKLPADPTTYSKVWWGTSAYWNLSCGGTPYFLEMAFDTLGINYLRCPRGYTVGTTPVLTQDRLAGDYIIDCSGQGGGTVHGTWDWVRCGGACTSTNTCATAASYTCTTGGPVCTVTQTATVGTACTTSTGLPGACNTAGTCTECALGAPCVSTNPCSATSTIDCSTGAPLCVDRTYKAAGTSCTTSTGGPGTCSPSSATSPSVCVDCNQGATCTSNDPCAATATIQCGSGAPVCTVQTWKPTGADCSGGAGTAVCTGATTNPPNQCTACVQGQACTLSDPCVATATIECSSGAPVCTARTYLAAGASCGTTTVPAVCSGPSTTPPNVCNACTQGASCTSTNECVATATLDCTSGTPVCVPQTYKDAGTSCTGGVCSGPAGTPPNTCSACAQGQTCTVSDPCVASATIQCGSGAAVCTPQTYKLPGTDCGATPGTAVCNAANPPACVPCASGQACTSTDPCVLSAQIVCSSGSPVCTPTAYKLAGADCGTTPGTAVCNTANPPVCTSCTSGQACTTTDPCVASAQTVCSSGTAVCSPTAYKLAGDSCGTTANPAVCSGGTPDQCVPCAAGAPCTSTNPCVAPTATSVVTCNTGAPVCTSNAFLPDASACNTTGVCLSGSCTACVPGTPCIPAANPCHVGSLSCADPTYGTQCVDTGPTAADGTVCNPATGATCTAGQCCGSACVTAACTTGTITCSAGAASCVDNGTNTSVCTGTQVCNGSGVCQ